MPLHRYGIDSIESCLEESLQNEAVKLMASYLSPKYYLTSKMISVLMNILKVGTLDTFSLFIPGGTIWPYYYKRGYLLRKWAQ